MAKLQKSESVIANKQNVAERRRAKRQAVAAKFKGGDEPEINPLEYRISMVKALNWYNISVELKDIRRYLNEYLTETNQKKLITVLNQASDFEVRSLGTLCRMKHTGQYLSDEHEAYITNRIKDLVDLYDKPKKSNVSTRQNTTKSDKTKEQSLINSDAIEGAIDEFVKTKKSSFDAAAYLKSKEVPAAVAKDMGQYYKTVLADLEESTLDPKEYGYSNWNKAQFKKYIEFIKSIVDACTQQLQTAKVRKPRKKRVVNPSKVVAKLKYCKEFVGLNLKSIRPESIVDSTELWVYNSKYRKLAVYKAEKGGKLSVKGTSVIGYDVKESTQVMLRKPEEFFKNVQLAKKALSIGLKSIKTKSVTPNGRINEETILLGAF